MFGIRPVWIVQYNILYLIYYLCWNRSSSNSGNWNFEKIWMSFPKIHPCHALDNWNFGKISGWNFQNFPIIMDQEWQSVLVILVDHWYTMTSSRATLVEFFLVLLHEVMYTAMWMVSNHWLPTRFCQCTVLRVQQLDRRKC